MDHPILDLSACSLVDRMRWGELSAVETMRAFLDRIAALDPKLNAFAYLDPDIALAAAERVDQVRASGVAPGPLHGLPVAVKDIIDTADMPTEFGAEIFAGRRPGRDAVVVHRLRAAGAVVIGKTVTSQYALFVPGPTKNPHDAAHTPGGSSSGSSPRSLRPARSACRPMARSFGQPPIAASSGSSRASASCHAPEYCGRRR